MQARMWRENREERSVRLQKDSYRRDKRRGCTTKKKRLPVDARDSVALGTSESGRHEALWLTVEVAV